jgi:hypothetical protein
MRKTKKPLESYSWRQAEKLMDKLLEFCLDWEERKTPGIDPDTYWINKEESNVAQARHRGPPRR